MAFGRTAKGRLKKGHTIKNGRVVKATGSRKRRRATKRRRR